jgi:hypothetical protein
VLQAASPDARQKPNLVVLWESRGSDPAPDHDGSIRAAIPADTKFVEVRTKPMKFNRTERRKEI